MRSKLLAAALATAVGVAIAVMPAFAQAPPGPPVNVRGKIVKLDGQTLSVREKTGKTVMVTLAPNTAVHALARKKLSDIKDGDYIASTSMRGKDGKLHAIEVHFLPPAVPELQTPWDLRRGSVMTNAHVTGIVKVMDGDDIALAYKGQTTDVVVGPKTTIVGPAPATMADLKPGKAVFLRAFKSHDGALMANNATVEKHGVKPPM
jgi:hypothetical protein